MQTTVGDSSQITVQTMEQGNSFEFNQDFVQQVTTTSGIDTIQPLLEENAFVFTQNNKSDNVVLKGITNENVTGGIYKLQDNLVSGTGSITNGIMIGKELALERSLKVGDKVTLATAGGKKQDFIINGIFNLGNSTVNERFVFIDIMTLRDLTRVVPGQSISAYEIQVKDVFKADTIAKEISKLSGNYYHQTDNLKITNWKETNADLLTALQSQSMSSKFIQVSVLISVTIAIASVLNILVVQKSREIGILKAMGLKDRQSSLIFLYQSLALGVIGTGMGMLLGLSLLYLFSTFARTAAGDPVIKIFVYWDRFFATGGIAILAAAAAGILPARQTSKLNPVEIINNG